MLTQQRTRVELRAPWPPDRYEVFCRRGMSVGDTRDRYHFADLAVESAQLLEQAGLASRVVVIRLADSVVIYDRYGGVELPRGEW